MRAQTFGDLDPGAQQAILQAAAATRQAGAAQATQASMFGASATASEALAANALVNLWDHAGAVAGRNASATDATKPAHAFTLEAVAMGAEIILQGPGQIAPIAGLTPGPQYLATAAGAVTAAMPAITGNLQQLVGVAVNEGLLFQPQQGAPVAP